MHSNSAANSADHDNVWRELEDIDTSASLPNPHKDIDQLQVHLNGELVLPDALILDSTIPFDLVVDLPLIKEEVEELPLQLPLDNKSPSVTPQPVQNQTTTTPNSPSVQAAVAAAAANSNKSEPATATATTSVGVNKSVSVVKQEVKTEPTFAAQSAATNVSVSMQGATTGAGAGAANGGTRVPPGSVPTTVRAAAPAPAPAQAQVPVRSFVNNTGSGTVGGVGVGGVGVARRARPGGMSVMMGRVEKRVPCTLKEKREREARQFPRSLLTSLDGTTSAEVRKMSAEERELVLYKRKLRNRESARRSRQKRQAALADLQDEIGELQGCATGLVDTALKLRSDNQNLRDRLEKVQAENRALRAVVDANANATAAKVHANANATVNVVANATATPTPMVTTSCADNAAALPLPKRNDARLGA